MSRDESIDWFHGQLSREEAEQILRDESKGTSGIFLVRESKKYKNSYVLSVIHMHEFFHYQIQQHGDDAFFSIDSTSIHHGMDELIEYYRNNDSNLCTRLEKFVKKGPPPTKFCRFGKANLLHRATKFNNLQIVKEILSTPYVGLDSKDENGMTAVHLAPINKVNPEIMKVLIEKGAALLSHDSVGNTALHYACSNNCMEMVKLLVNANKNLIHTRNNSTGIVPLHEAARIGNFEMVQFLLNNHAASMPRTLEGLFPSDLARENHHIEVAEYLEKFVPSISTFSHKWHHGTLDRESARILLLEKRNELYEKLKEEYPLTENVYVNDSKEINDLISGLFLVRTSERNQGRDVISILHDVDEIKTIRNYIIRKSGKHFYIDDGPYLPSLEHLISYYMTFPDGLPVKLTRMVEPIPKPPIPIPTPPRTSHQSLVQPKLLPTPSQKQLFEAPLSTVGSGKSKTSTFKFIGRRSKKHSLPTVMPHDDTSPVIAEKFNKSLSFSTDFLNNNNSQSVDNSENISCFYAKDLSIYDPLPTGDVRRITDDEFTNSDLENPKPIDQEVIFKDPPDWKNLELYDAQNNLIKQATSENYYVSKDDLKTEKEIGAGEFGNVLRGSLTLTDGRKLLVAVKRLHTQYYEENYAAFLKEASVMIKLDNPYIVKLIGITKGPPIGLVQELLELGSLENYLAEHTDEIENKDIDKWASQIALGMEYLESKRFVHRDLASRNILLAAKDHCKISDFGLSRALGADSDFYQSSTGGRWPLKWYAPESFSGKFSHASDVWSFGVTLWELYSRGGTPYDNKSGNEVCEFISKGNRLGQPELCPNEIYQVMINCWQTQARHRPTFSQLSQYFLHRLNGNVNNDDSKVLNDNEDDEHSNTVYV